MQTFKKIFTMQTFKKFFTMQTFKKFFTMQTFKELNLFCLLLLYVKFTSVLERNIVYSSHASYIRVTENPQQTLSIES